MPVTPPAEKTMPGMAMLLGAVGIGMCGYSSRQLALHHRPSTRVLHWVGTHTDAGGAGMLIDAYDFNGFPLTWNRCRPFNKR
ncbi:hypothetical protein GOODEAATRI_004384 [Goodea atripinnis]|uniref:Uncharacterized protein n=1 Tax=Goodea atripinnis TaxID=208336 RepID=A0ABV0NHF6_9TELE